MGAARWHRVDTALQFLTLLIIISLCMFVSFPLATVYLHLVGEAASTIKGPNLKEEACPPWRLYSKTDWAKPFGLHVHWTSHSGQEMGHHSCPNLDYRGQFHS